MLCELKYFPHFYTVKFLSGSYIRRAKIVPYHRIHILNYMTCVRRYFIFPSIKQRASVVNSTKLFLYIILFFRILYICMLCVHLAKHNASNYIYISVQYGAHKKLKFKMMMNIKFVSNFLGIFLSFTLAIPFFIFGNNLYNIAYITTFVYRYITFFL